MENFFSVKEETVNEIDVMSSKFIGVVCFFNDVKKINDMLDLYKKKYPKAKHYCYAYKVGELVKASDDGEPSGTATKPLLNVISNNKLNNVLIIVVRYFGGKLLGSGRLLRTYSECVVDVINKAKLVEFMEISEFSIDLDIDKLGIFKSYLKRNHLFINKIVFNDKIYINFYAPINFDEDLESIFYPSLAIKERKVSVIEKEKYDDGRMQS